MQVSVEAGEGLERRLTVTVPAEQIESEVDKRLKEMARTARLAGFRPGKVPVKVLRQRYQQQLQREVLADLVSPTFSDAISQEQLSPAGTPRIEPEIDPAAGRFGYTAVFEVLPSFELAGLSGATIKRPRVEISDADVAEVIDRLRGQRKTWNPVERPAQQGDQLTIDYQGRVDGEPFEGGAGSDVNVELGSGRAMPGLEEGLVGALAGEERTVEREFPEDHQAPALAGKTAQFAVTVKEVTEPELPEVDAEFVRTFGIDDGDVERFRGEVRENLERELRQRTRARIRDQVMDALLEANPIGVPETLVKNEIDSLKNQTLESAGGSTEIQLPDELFADAARRRVALGLIVGEVVKRNDLKAEPERVRAMVEDLAAGYESPEEVIRYYYADSKRLEPIQSRALEEAVVDWAMQQMTVEDESMSFDDLATQTGSG